MPFLTDKQIEELLIDEARSIRFPDGMTQVIRWSQFLWQTYDWLLSDKVGFTEDHIFAIYDTCMDGTNRPRREALMSAIHHLAESVKDLRDPDSVIGHCFYYDTPFTLDILKA
jgi:hypothetical protein